VSVRSSLVGLAIKRTADVAGALALGVPALPIVVVAGALVWLRSPGPFFFRSMRETRDGKPFAMLKLRTMVADAEERLERALAASPARRDEWVRYRRLADDPRIVPGPGRVLRQWSVDELPQLWNVLRGEMSLVGPRPLELDVGRRLPPALMQARRRVRPGMTGLWQVSGRSEVDLESLCAIDAEYVQGWSLRTDLAILLRTPAAVLSRRGAY
jgi:lipopolysaccharide/colanic/teichoic acid biosynthesis glycosyltransferase